MRVLKANKQQFELVQKYVYNNNKINFVKDINYDRVCSVSNKANVNFKGILSILNEMEEIDFVPSVSLELLPDTDKRYIEVRPAGPTGKKRAHWISTELYNIEYPESIYNSNYYAFPILKHLERYYLQIDENRIFHVHTDANLENLIFVMFGTLEQDELDGLSDFITSSETFVFSQIIPEGHDILTHSQIFS